MNGIQSELFVAPALEHKEKGLRQLNELHFEAARDHFAIAREIDPGLADLDFLVALSEYAHRHGVKPQASPARLVALWHAAQQSYRNDDLSWAACQYLLQLVARRLLQLGQFTPEGFCIEKDEILHRGVLHIVLQQWQAAHHELLNLVTAQRDKASALHWAYLGDAAYMLKRWKDANMAYVCALFSDPLAVDQQRLQHPELKKLLQVLKHEMNDERLACAMWPVHAWMKDILQIPCGNNFLLALVRRQRSILGSELMLEAERCARQFSLCLYIDQAGLRNEIQFDVRHEMKQLDPELFADYLCEIANRAKLKA
ncbi:MAG: hypothetical protein ONB46_22585 [candidate division KSB1 bacterium]|nr:hypothetical protein [candidate division KSB1 bacterium]MDZ7368571.1 hypothetical protein [candidate division KSB1 bacterium]MDZ7406391.1 hypothetical protein [candidate division KSB1 bacterium]